MALDDKAWFTEVFQNEGTGFSLSIKEKLFEIKSDYQFIEVYETETFGRLMVIDGCVMLTQRDNFLYHEMMSHPAIFSHPEPKKVVIIGGGDCGTLREVLKHESIERVVQVDIDEQVTRASERFFPELCESNDDRRADIRFDDGIKWMQDAEENSADIVIVDSTDPVGPAEGLFAVDFYKACQRVLGDKGILVQQSESPLLHTNSIIKDIHQDMRSAGFSNVQTLSFPQPVYPTGWWSSTMASANTNVSEFREAEAKAKVFSTLYYNAEIHRGAVAVPEFMKFIYQS